jgi:hypothetical protein
MKLKDPILRVCLKAQENGDFDSISAWRPAHPLLISRNMIYISQYLCIIYKQSNPSPVIYLNIKNSSFVVLGIVLRTLAFLNSNAETRVIQARLSVEELVLKMFDGKLAKLPATTIE